jgi:hypothetical protein
MSEATTDGGDRVAAAAAAALCVLTRRGIDVGDASCGGLAISLPLPLAALSASLEARARVSSVGDGEALTELRTREIALPLRMCADREGRTTVVARALGGDGMCGRTGNSAAVAASAAGAEVRDGALSGKAAATTAAAAAAAAAIAGSAPSDANETTDGRRLRPG